MSQSEAKILQSDTELMVAFQGGDESAFVELILRYEASLLRYLTSKMGGDTHLAEDVLQDVLVRLLRVNSQYDTQRRFEPYLYSIADHCAIDRLRREGRHTHVSLDADSALSNSINTRQGTATDNVIRAEEIDRVQRALATLSAEAHSLLLSFYIDGHSFKEIAAINGINYCTVKRRMHAARESVRIALTTSLDPEENTINNLQSALHPNDPAHIDHHEYQNDKGDVHDLPPAHPYPVLLSKDADLYKHVV